MVARRLFSAFWIAVFCASVLGVVPARVTMLAGGVRLTAADVLLWLGRSLGLRLYMAASPALLLLLGCSLGLRPYMAASLALLPAVLPALVLGALVRALEIS